MTLDNDEMYNFVAQPYMLDENTVNDPFKIMVTFIKSSDQGLEKLSLKIDESAADNFLIELMTELFYARSKASLMKKDVEKPHIQAKEKTKNMLKDLVGEDLNEEHIEHLIEEGRSV